MLYKMSLSVNEIPPLFVQLDQLEDKDEEEGLAWNEKARWIRYEEQAEDVLGRWSKPHVATLPQTSIDELKNLLNDGKMMFDVLLSDMTEIADAVANELLDYFNDLESARQFAEIFCLHHHHHHEKKIKKNNSHSNLLKVMSSPNFHDVSNKQDGEVPSPVAVVPSVPNKLMKYQYSFTDAKTYEGSMSNASFKENTKFRKKVHTKAEGASILVMPVHFVKTPKLVFIRLEAATELQCLLEVKLRSRFIVVIIGPHERQHQLYEVGRAMATCLADDVCRELFYSASSSEELHSAVQKFNRDTMVIPPSEWNPRIRIEPPERFLSKEERNKEPELCNYIHDNESKCDNSDHSDSTLMFSKRPFAGMFNDILRKLPHYVSDFSQTFNLQCIATTLYMYLVSLCSLVAFGGLFGEKTDNLMATMECILAGSVGGGIYSLFSGQPLNIISTTGPMLILEQIIKGLCDQKGLDFMTFRLWVGIWTALFLLILVMFNLSFLVKYITRFTEDSFAALIAIIFIIDAFKSTYKLRKTNSEKYSTLNSTDNSTKIYQEFKTTNYEQETYFYFSVILFFLTFVVCSTLKDVRNKPYLPTKVRQVLSDFAVLIAIVIASGLDAVVGLKTLKLNIPSSFHPTSDHLRGWVIPFTSPKNPWYTILIAMAPALIATILVFMDQQITAVIINRKEFLLKKSNGYHLDLFIVALVIAISSILGLPWIVASTVLALSHINSLKVMSENAAPGEHAKFIGVCEQRGTALIMSLLIGLSVLLTPLLSKIPMAVLYGVFLFMGMSALNGMQFIDRILILFMPAKYQPDYKYLRYVSTKRVHIFTGIQFIMTAGLYMIKFIEKIAILFPILVLATCGIRKLLDYVFTQGELFWLDDILPGSENIKKFKNEKKILNNKIDSSSEFLKNTEKELYLNEKQVLLNSSEQFDMLEKNDNCKKCCDGQEIENGVIKRGNVGNQVKFVTSFSNIQETEDS